MAKSFEAHSSHRTDEATLKSRQARAGEPELSGDRWWPNEGVRAVDLLEEGKVLTSAERWASERELAAREQRHKSPAVIKRESVRLEPTLSKGVYIGYIVSPSPGLEARNKIMAVCQLAPDARTEMQCGWEVVCHILGGHGYSLIDGQKYEWGPHDSLHIQFGAWYQHVNTGDLPANILFGTPGPLLEHIVPYPRVYKGDSFSDLPDDYKPEHPFTKERVAVGYVEGMKWMSHLQAAMNRRIAEQEQKRRQARVILKAEEAVIERSQHKGDWKVGLVDQYLGFDNRIMAMYIHQLPPNCHTETHKHSEASIYVLSGRGYTIVEGERWDWQEGDCIHVQPGDWHQHFNTDPERVSQHLIMGGGGRLYELLSNRGIEVKGEATDESLFQSLEPDPAWWK